MKASRIIILPLILSGIVAFAGVEMLMRRSLAGLALAAIIYAFFILFQEPAPSAKKILFVSIAAAVSFLLLVLTWIKVGW
ncbi:hypothetical protein [Planomicrobium sp. CPCC 101079]|uniref:hypothetical protein n=1 Tax=Planomicrobium sp. CPCC 101079 TaxID=2599618 RepID=UPI0011B69BB9|nr:hypothetical protein [Planomicrobium sp. CPCC 101079]TWT14283.1 hypothetical protein FQV28_01395 [Planomicrobium sp. CPCC 101079]